MLSWIERTAFMEVPDKNRRAHILHLNVQHDQVLNATGNAGLDMVAERSVYQFFLFWTDKKIFFPGLSSCSPYIERARIPKRQHWLTSLSLIAPVNLYSAVYSLTSFNHCVLANGFV